MNHGSTNRRNFTGWRRLVFGRNPRVTLIRLIATSLLLTILFTVVFIPVRVTGVSMMPTYHDGQINLVNRLAYCATPPKRGDVVAIRIAGERALLFKRVIGLPGEKVLFRRGVVEINGKPLAEPYLKFRPYTWDEQFVLRQDEYLVVGDNRVMPADLHYHGPVGRQKIVGKALF